MEKFKFTEGPWCVVKFRGGSPAINSKYGTVVLQHYYEEPVMNGICKTNQMANAYLIAAAPDLLEALIEITELFKRVEPFYSGDLNRIKKAENAINKALNQQ